MREQARRLERDIDAANRDRFSLIQATSKGTRSRASPMDHCTLSCVVRDAEDQDEQIHRAPFETQRIARETEQAQAKVAQAKADLAARKKTKGQKMLLKQQREKENVQFVSALCVSEQAPAA
jgi:hypothetical protein